MTIAEKLSNALDDGKINLGKLVLLASDYSVREEIYNNTEYEDYYQFNDSSTLYVNWNNNTVLLG